jgi:hypothetical protein
VTYPLHETASFRLDAIEAIERLLAAHPNATIQIRRSDAGTDQYVIFVKDAAEGTKREASTDLRHAIRVLHAAYASEARERLERAREYAEALGVEART